MHGEASSAPLENLGAMREKLRQTLKDFAPENIFNCDETGLFWKMKPSRTISDGPVSGIKQSKDRVTFYLPVIQPEVKSYLHYLYINLKIPELLNTSTRRIFQ